jgi:Leucine Rich repeat
MQAAHYLLDDHSMATIAESLRCAVGRLAQQGDRPWTTTAGASLAAALSRAHVDLQVAVLSSCPDKLIASAPTAVLRPALAAQCTTRGEPPLLELWLPARLLAMSEASGQIVAAAAALTHVQSIVIGAGGVDGTTVPLGPALASLTAMPSLIALQIDGGVLDHADLAFLTSAACSARLCRFKAMKLRFCPGTVGAFVAQLRCLQQLQLFRCASLTDADMQQFSLLTGLQLLALEGESQLSSKGLAHITALTGLVHLCLNECLSVRDDSLMHLTALTGLSFLKLCNCPRIGDAGLAHLAALTSLSHLELARCGQPGDIGVSHLYGPTESYLDVIECGNCPEISDAGFAHLAALTGLSSLGLCGCEYVGDFGLAHLAALTGLSSLDLSSCQAADSGLAHVATLNRLTCLRLCNCWDVGDAGVAHLAALTGLVSLNLSGCYGLGDDGVAHLAALPRLTYLNLDQCDQISDVGLAHLVALTRLDISIEVEEAWTWD